MGCLKDAELSNERWDDLFSSFLYVFADKYQNNQKVIVDGGNLLLSLYRNSINDDYGMFFNWARMMNQYDRFEKYAYNNTIDNDIDLIRFSESIPVTHNIVVSNVPKFYTDTGYKNNNNVEVMDTESAKSEVNNQPNQKGVFINAGDDARVKVKKVNIGDKYKETTNNISIKKGSGSFIQKVLRFLHIVD